MDYDLLLVVGLVLMALTIPSMMSAWIDNRSPRTATILLFAAAGLVVTALSQSPRPYTIEGIPHVFIEVIGRYIR
jgi:hypothetical protein